MTPSRPPKLATWLLKLFGCSDYNRKYEERGTAVTIAAGARVNADVVLIRN